MKCPRNRTANNPLNAHRGHHQTTTAGPGLPSQSGGYPCSGQAWVPSVLSQRRHTQAAGRREHQGSAEWCCWFNRLWQGCPAAKRYRETTTLEKETQIGERSKETELPIPSFAFSFVESTKFSSAGGTPRVKGDRPLYTSAAIFSPQGDNAKSKMSTGQGCHQQGSTWAPNPWQQHLFLDGVMQRWQEEMDWRKAGGARARLGSPGDEGPALSTATDFKALSGCVLST